jgi:hypothetical protein
MVMILVESTDGSDLHGTLELPMDHAVFRTVARLSGQTAVTPQLSFGAEPVWCLDERDQKGRSNRTDRRDLA